MIFWPTGCPDGGVEQAPGPRGAVGGPAGGTALPLGAQPPRQPRHLRRIQLKDQQAQKRPLDVQSGKQLVGETQPVGEGARTQEKTGFLLGGKRHKETYLLSSIKEDNRK